MQKKQERTISTSWIVPLGILVVTILVMLFNFSTQSKNDAKRSVEEHFSTIAKDYSSQIRFYLLSARETQLAAAQILAEMGEDVMDEMPAVLHGLTVGGDYYSSAFCDSKGKALINTGEEIDLSNTSYYPYIKEGKDIFIYTKDDGISGTPAIVSIAPVTTYEGDGYLLTYFNPDKIDSIVSKTEFDSKAFYLLVNTDGVVAGAFGKVDETIFLNKDSFWESLQGSVVGDASYDAVQKHLNNLTSGIVQVSRDGEARTLVYEPILAGNWYWVIGLNQHYVANQESHAWKSGSDMITRLFMVVFLFLGAIAVINIITKIKTNERNKELENKADTDLLTELSNKVATERKIKEYLESNPEQQAILFVLDIDNFKKINDTMGHAFGDEVLRTLGHRLRAEFRVTDIIGRTGGDEFMILLKNIPDTNMVKREGEKVERFFRTFEAGGYVKYAATASIGAAIFPNDANNFESLYKAADRALYVAKKRGKNQLAFYTDTEVQQSNS